MLRNGDLDNQEIEIELASNPSSPIKSMEIPGMQGGMMGMIKILEIFLEKDLDKKKKKRKLTVRESYDFLLNEESEKLIDNDSLIKRSIDNAEQDGIVFIDEIDKICGKIIQELPKSVGKVFKETCFH